MRLVASLGDGHTWVEPHTAAVGAWFPVRLYEFTDGIFVTSAHRSAAYLAGAEVLQIGGMPAREALDRARELIGADNAFGRLENLFAASNAALMRAIGLADSNGRLPIRARVRGGRTVDLRLEPMTGRPTFDWRYRSEPFGLRVGETEDWIAAFGLVPATEFRDRIAVGRPPHLRNRNYYHSAPLGNGVYYMQINFVSNNPDEPFLQFFRRALSEVDRLRPRRLVLDWRYNSGGDGSMVTPMIHEFIRREADRPWQELYFLVGRKTFSASIMALDAFIDHTDISLVGEPAGAALNHFGDAETISLPRTQLRLHVSTLWHQLARSDDSSAFVPIDVPAQFSYADYSAGRDPAVDAILRGEEMRSLPVIALADGAPAARRVYEERKRRFGPLGWWRAADEARMNRAAFALQRAGRASDAAELFVMTTEIHPRSWRAWSRLGNAQRGLGRPQEALHAYRTALSLAPLNESVRASIAELTRPQ